jgi:hypothetical protein
MQPLAINVDVNSPLVVGDWVDAQIKLVPTSANLATTVLPVAVFANPGPVPKEIVIETDTTNGFRDIDLSGLVNLPDLTYTHTTAVIGQRFDRVITTDSNRDDPYDSTSGTFLTLVGPTSAGLNVEGTLIAKTSTGANGDIDLYVGIDVNGDGLAAEDEELCRSTTHPGVNEQCVVTTGFTQTTQRYWVLVHRYAPSAAGPVPIDVVHIPSVDSADTTIGLSGPRVVNRLASFKSRVSWNVPALNVGDSAYAIAHLGASRTRPSSVGDIVIRIKRTAASTPAPIVMHGKDDSELISLPAGVAHERIVIDVPLNAAGLHVTTSGTGEVDLYLAKATEGVTPPTFAAAPARGTAAGTSIHAGATESIDLLAPTLTPGRWYITPVNSGATAATFTLTSKLDFAAGSVRPTMQSYFNPNRSGHGMFLSQVSNIWALVWYTYLEDGTPVWYYAQANAPTGNDGSWRVPLTRYTWNGSLPYFDTVGEVILTFNTATSFHLLVVVEWPVRQRTVPDPRTLVVPDGEWFAGAIQRWLVPAGQWRLGLQRDGSERS